MRLHLRLANGFLVSAVLTSAAAAAIPTTLCSTVDGDRGRLSVKYGDSGDGTIALTVEAKGLAPSTLYFVTINTIPALKVMTDHEGAVQKSWSNVVNGQRRALPESVLHVRSGDKVAVGALSVLVGTVGDMQPDCVVNSSDVRAMKLALLDPAAFAELFPRIDVDYSGDINGDGVFNIEDYELAVREISGGSGSNSAP